MKYKQPLHEYIKSKSYSSVLSQAKIHIIKLFDSRNNEASRLCNPNGVKFEQLARVKLLNKLHISWDSDDNGKESTITFH